jgi:hypothetical protein
MLRKIHHRHPETSPTGASWAISEPLWKFCDALREAVVAHRQYEWLRSRGVPHESALRESLGVGHSTCECHSSGGPRETATNPVREGAFPSIGVLSYVK